MILLRLELNVSLSRQLKSPGDQVALSTNPTSTSVFHWSQLYWCQHLQWTTVHHLEGRCHFRSSSSSSCARLPQKSNPPDRNNASISNHPQHLGTHTRTGQQFCCLGKRTTLFASGSSSHGPISFPERLRFLKCPWWNGLGCARYRTRCKPLLRLLGFCYTLVSDPGLNRRQRHVLLCIPKVLGFLDLCICSLSRIWWSSWHICLRNTGRYGVCVTFNERVV